MTRSEGEEWRSTTLGAICHVNPPRPKVDALSDNTPVTFVPMAAVDEVTGTISRPELRTLAEVRTKSYRTFAPGDVLFAKITPCMENGKSAIVPEMSNGLGFGSTEFHVLRPAADVNPRFIWHYIRQERFRALAEEQMSGSVGQLRVPAAFLKDVPFNLPDKEVQDTIVRTLDLATDNARNAVSHLAKARRAIERFRQSVLAAASAGRLTADWREELAINTSLVRELGSLKASRRRPVALPDLSLVSDAPSGWEIVALDLLVDLIEAGKSFNAQPRPAKEDEWGVVKVSAMSWGRFLEGENKAIPKDKKINPLFEIRPGDLLISRANTAELAGATVLVDQTRPRLLLSDKSLRLVTHPPIDKAWLNYALRAPVVRRQFADRATGTSDSMRNLSQEKILATTLALPPVEEQVEIARLVDQLFALASRLAARIDKVSRRIERTSQAFLAKAFRGDLLLTAGGAEDAS